jgi:DNA-3-methyladenine glycosylase II
MPARKKSLDKGLAYEDEALRHFKKVDHVLYKAALPHRGKLSARLKIKRRNDDLFAALARSIAGQQLSVRAAQTIWGRVEEVLDKRVTPSQVLKVSVPRLRKAGLSASKVKALKSLAKSIEKEGLNLLALRSSTYEEALENLTKIWGIGPWTVEMFLIFALGARDIFSSGDLGLVRSMERLYALPRGTSRTDIERLAERWSPHRSFACLILWEAYDS